MTTIDWILIISAIAYICLGVFAFKFPRGRGDWHKEPKETLFMVMSIVVFLMLFFLLWYASAVIDWPNTLTIIFWAAVLVLAGLVIVSIFIPGGISLSFGKKEIKTADDDE
jgi:cell division protein FtsW (lipid II flippase)